MNTKTEKTFKANIFQFLKIHIITGMMIFFVSLAIFRSLESSIALIAAVLVSSIVVPFLINYRMKDIILREKSIEGPFRRKLRDHRVSIPYEKIDIQKCVRPSIMKNGILFGVDSQKIFIYSMYFGKRSSDQLFQMIIEKINNQVQGTAKERCRP